MSEELREFQKVPGEWRCLNCRGRLSTEPTTERPECPYCHYEKRMVPLAWKLFGPEQQDLLSGAREERDEVSEGAQVALERLEILLGHRWRWFAAGGGSVGLFWLLFELWR